MEKEVSCYTYSVSMVVHVFAPSESEASAILDTSGGYISSRKVDLLDAVTVSIDSNKDDKEED